MKICPLIVLCWLSMIGLVQSTAAQQSFRLKEIKFTGLKRFTELQVAPFSELKIDQQLTIEDLQKATEQLSRTGLFDTVSYQYKFENGALQVEFLVEESSHLLPCNFDNFVWMNEEEIRQFLKKEVPIFDGTAPPIGSVLDRIIESLNGFLKKQKIPGTVTLMAAATDRSNKLDHLFRVEGVDIVISNVKFEGLRALDAKQLEKVATPLIGKQYSRFYAAQFASANLVPMYRKLGFLGVRLNPKASVLSAEPGSVRVLLTYDTEEGPSYKWDRAFWSGNIQFPSEELDKQMAMIPGQVADGIRIDEGLKTVKALYARHGYVEAQIEAGQEFSSAGSQVRYHFSVKEGTQYRMGGFEIVGASQRTAELIKEKWLLRPGDVFNGAYAEEFVDREVSGAQGPKGVKVEASLDREKKLVNVTIRFL